MSGVQPSAKDNGVVVTVLGMVAGLAMAASGVYLQTTGTVGQGPLGIIGLGAVIVVLSGVAFRKRLADVPTRDPAEIVRADLNSPEVILRDLGKLALGWVGLGLFWEFVMAAPPDPSPGVIETATGEPVLVVGWLLFNVLVGLAIMFGSYRERGLGDTRSFMRG